VYFYRRFDNKIYSFREVSGFTVAQDEFTVTAPDIVTFTVYTSPGVWSTTTKSFKLSEIIGALGWEIYRNEEMGIEFRYPGDKMEFLKENLRETCLDYSFQQKIGKIADIEFRGKDNKRNYDTTVTVYSTDVSSCFHRSGVTAYSSKEIKVFDNIPVKFEAMEWNIECSPTIEIDFSFKNEGKSIYNNVRIGFMLDDVGKIWSDALRKSEDPCSSGKEGEILVRKIIDEDLTEGDKEELRIYKKMLSTFKFLE
jgi:hypothetical protein